MLSKLLPTLGFVVIITFVLVVPVKAGIFDGTTGGGGGIFGNLGDSIGSIFDGIVRGVFPGGAVLPPSQPTPTLAAGQPTPIPPGAPNLGKQIKLSLEWDAVSMGGEGVVPQEADPLAVEHVGKIRCPCNTSYYDTGETYSAPPPSWTPPANASQAWILCTPQSRCQLRDVEHVLYGWCGHPPTMLNASRVPGDSVGSDGPNRYTLPNAVSNKYIRRDGYAFRCVSSCQGESCSIDNYIEFQTMVYPSNALSMYVKAENLSQEPVDDVVVTVQTNTGDGSQYALPQNLDFPYKLRPTNAPAYVNMPFLYSHGSTLETKNISRLTDMIPVDHEVKFVPTPTPGGVNPTPGPGAWLEFGPFDLGAVGKPNAVVTVPLQSDQAVINNVPHIVGPSPTPPSSYPAANGAVPCACTRVRTHDVKNVDGSSPSCTDANNGIVRNPTYHQCQDYYQFFDAEGQVCDQRCIQVPGCPPPRCFVGSKCTAGSLSVCPMGRQINTCTTDDSAACRPNPNGCLNENTPIHQICGDANGIVSKAPDLMKNLLGKIMPDFSEIAKVVTGAIVSAVGCPGMCEQQVPPMIAGTGGLIPRDYNFVCDVNDKSSLTPVGEYVEQARCTGGDGGALVRFDNPLFGTYRDVTGLNGCGYNASSNNAVIGPIEITALYGGIAPNYSSQSTLLASIPIGGRITDDQGRPYGWPSTGEIEQDWGYTGEAAQQGSYSSDPSRNYGQFRFCSAVAANAQCNKAATIANPSLNTAKPVGDLIAALEQGVGPTNMRVFNWLRKATDAEVTKQNIRDCYNDVVNQAIVSNNDPSAVLAAWIEESMASNYASFSDVADFGCTAVEHNNFTAQLSCFNRLQNAYATGAQFAACRLKDSPPNTLTVKKFLQVFLGGQKACEKNTFGASNFATRFKFVYELVRADNSQHNLSSNAATGGVLNIDNSLSLPRANWSN